MKTCSIEKLVWVLALVVLLGSFYAGDFRTVGMIITVIAALWYGLVCPLAEEFELVNFRRKGSVN